MVAAHYLSNRFNGFAWCANESDANETFGRELGWIETRKPLKRFHRIGPYCNPRLKPGDNETFARASLACRELN